MKNLKYVGLKGNKIWNKWLVWKISYINLFSIYKSILKILFSNSLKIKNIFLFILYDYKTSILNFKFLSRILILTFNVCIRSFTK